MNQREAGIDKCPSVPLFPADILADSELQQCDLNTFGAWMKALFYMLRDKKDRGSGTLKYWARKWGCSEREAKQVIDDLKNNNPCTVTVRNDIVTLVCRRLERQKKARKANADRQKRHRAKDREQGNADVTREYMLPSSSFSFSSSSSKQYIYFSALDVTEYSRSIGWELDGEIWCKSYQAKGWLIGKDKPMKDWKAQIDVWKLNGWTTKKKDMKTQTEIKRSSGPFCPYCNGSGWMRFAFILDQATNKMRFADDPAGTCRTTTIPCACEYGTKYYKQDSVDKRSFRLEVQAWIDRRPKGCQFAKTKEEDRL